VEAKKEIKPKEKGNLLYTYISEWRGDRGILKKSILMLHGFLRSSYEMAPTKKEEAETRASMKSRTGLERLEGEEALPEDIRRFLPILRRHLVEKQKEFGLKENTSSDQVYRYVKEYIAKEIDLDRVHFLSEDAYLNDVSDMETGGLSNGNYVMTAKAVFLRNKESGGGKVYRNDFERRLDILKLFQHEALHMTSYEADYALEGKKVDLYRQGYMVFNPKYGFERFRGLNEAVVETENIALFAEEIPELREEFGGEEKEREWHKGRKIYERYRMVLENIMEAVSRYRGVDGAEVWKEYEEGLFTGKLGHLKVIDKIYGPGSVRLLASMGTYSGETVRTMPDGKDKGDWMVEQQDSYVWYFSDVRSDEERKEIAYELLSKKEYERFLRKNT
jgi:hypothetical protein